MSIKLPSRYEDINIAYRGRLIPNRELLDMVIKAKKSIDISGGIRFLPIYGESGAGKSCAAREIGTHIPIVKTLVLGRPEIENKNLLVDRIINESADSPDKFLVAIIDQYEETVIGREVIPTQFIEYLSLLDRNELREIPILFLWLTTDKEFRTLLVEATSRNRRILTNNNFTVEGPSKEVWPQIIEETFSFHNSSLSLADYGITGNELFEISRFSNTLGTAIENVGVKLFEEMEDIQNISEYQVIMIWPVADSTRNQRVLQFSRPKEGYKLNWDIWYNELNSDDKKQLPIEAFNRTRLYFDFRIIPVRAADLHRLCLHLEDEDYALGKTYLQRFKNTHFFHIVSGAWDSYDYNPVRETESTTRAKEAETWYSGVTQSPVQLGKRITSILRACTLDAKHEEIISSPYSTVKADIFVNRPGMQKSKIIIELKAYASKNTMPSTIKEQIKITLKRHAQLAGFLPRQ